MNSVNLNIIIKGGSAAGIIAATRTRRLNETARITIIEESGCLGYSKYLLCYYAGFSKTVKESIFQGQEEKLKEIYNINVYKNAVIKHIDTEEKKLTIELNEDYKIVEESYDQMIIADEDVTKTPKMFGMKSKNIFKLDRFEDANNIRDYIVKTGAKVITLVGATHYSILMAINLVKQGYEVAIIEEDSKTIDLFDDEFSYLIKEEILKNDIRLYTGTSIVKMLKNSKDHVSQLILKNNITLKTHLVVFFSTPEPDTSFARSLGLSLNEEGRIIVNEEMQSSDENIFAAGSIAESYNYITKLADYADLPGICQQQARIAASNVCGQQKEYSGLINTKIMKIGKLTVARTGIIQDTAKANNINTYPLTLFTGNKERFEPGAQQIHMKLIIDINSRMILGAHIASHGDGVDKKIDLISTAIYANLTVDELTNLELSFTPELSTAVDPLNMLGMIAGNQFEEISDTISINDIDLQHDFFILDIRNKQEKKKFHVDKSIWIPLPELRSRINELPKDSIIYIYGHVGRRGYIAERILKGNGFDKVYNIQGGITSIKMETNMIPYR